MRRVIFSASRFLALALALVVSTSAPGHATEVGGARKFGLGFNVGEPMGLSAKLFVAPGNAIDFGLSFYRPYGGHCYDRNNHWVGCDSNGQSSINADYLWQDQLARGTVRLDWHIGVGGRMWFYNPDAGARNFLLGARMPLGLDLTFDNPRFLEVFIELSPVFYLIPATYFDIEPQLGVRFYF